MTTKNLKVCIKKTKKSPKRAKIAPETEPKMGQTCSKSGPTVPQNLSRLPTMPENGPKMALIWPNTVKYVCLQLCGLSSCAVFGLLGFTFVWPVFCSILSSRWLRVAFVCPLLYLPFSYFQMGASPKLASYHAIDNIISFTVPSIDSLGTDL